MPVHFIDVLPTLQKISGAEYPKKFNGDVIFPSSGVSFLPQIMGDGSVERDDPIFWQWQYGKAVREGNWKLVAYKGVWELYNLKEDPVEEMNLINEEQEKAAALQSLYNDWAGQFEIIKKQY